MSNTKKEMFTAYEEMKKALEARGKELADADAEAASDLTALIEAHRKRKEDFEQEMAEQRETFEGEMEKAKGGWVREKSEQERAYEKVQDIANKAVSSAGERYTSWNAPERRSSTTGDGS